MVLSTSGLIYKFLPLSCVRVRNLQTEFSREATRSSEWRIECVHVASCTNHKHLRIRLLVQVWKIPLSRMECTVTNLASARTQPRYVSFWDLQLEICLRSRRCLDGVLLRNKMADFELTVKAFDQLRDYSTFHIFWVTLPLLSNRVEFVDKQDTRHVCLQKKRTILKNLLENNNKSNPCQT